MTRLANARTCTACRQRAVVTGDLCPRCRLDPDVVAEAMSSTKPPREGRASSPARPSRGPRTSRTDPARVGDVAADVLQRLAATGGRVPPATEAPWTLAKLGAPTVAFVAFTDGRQPAPQGSKSAKGRTRDGRIRMVESSAYVKPWRQTIIEALTVAGGALRLTGPVVLDVVFTIKRPQDRENDSDARPDRRPDLDKQLRAVSDALTTGGLWVEDSQLVAYRRAEAMYVGTPGDPDCLLAPGVLVRAWGISSSSAAEGR